ncbi:hypothetical protein PCE1_002329 [Barthelona sp. PCE]
MTSTMIPKTIVSAFRATLRSKSNKEFIEQRALFYQEIDSYATTATDMYIDLLHELMISTIFARKVTKNSVKRRRMCVIILNDFVTHWEHFRNTFFRDLNPFVRKLLDLQRHMPSRDVYTDCLRMIQQLRSAFRDVSIRNAYFALLQTNVQFPTEDMNIQSIPLRRKALLRKYNAAAHRIPDGIERRIRDDLNILSLYAEEMADSERKIVVERLKGVSVRLKEVFEPGLDALLGDNVTVVRTAERFRTLYDDIEDALFFNTFDEYMCTTVTENESALNDRKHKLGDFEGFEKKMQLTNAFQGFDSDTDTDTE